MHELSIVNDLIALASKELEKQNRKKVTRLEIKIGRLSGVESHYISSCFEVFKEGTCCEDAQLIIKMQNIIIKCKECGAQSELNENEFFCPVCKSDNVEVIDGEDMYLMRLEIE